MSDAVICPFRPAEAFNIEHIIDPCATRPFCSATVEHASAGAAHLGPKTRSMHV